MIPEAAVEAELVVEDGKIYLNGHVVAIVTGPEVTADQLSVLPKALTQKEALMNRLNAGLRPAK